MMEIKINKEIKEYKENIFFGLSTRQFFCSLLAVIVAAGLYLLLKDSLGKEFASWVCILGAVPFAALGFLQYHGMPAEKIAWAFLKSEFLYAGPRLFRNENYYYLMIQPQKKKLLAKLQVEKDNTLETTYGTEHKWCRGKKIAHDSVKFQAGEKESDNA